MYSEKKKICKFNLFKKCKNGEKCKFLHLNDKDINQILSDLHYLKVENESLKRELLKKQKTKTNLINDEYDVRTNEVYALENRLYSSFFKKNESKPSTIYAKENIDNKETRVNHDKKCSNYFINNVETFDERNNEKQCKSSEDLDSKLNKIKSEFSLELKSIKDDIKTNKNNQELINQQINKEVAKINRNYKELEAQILKKFQNFESEMASINKIIVDVENKIESAKIEIMRNQTVVNKNITDTMADLFRKHLLELRDETVQI
jgi:hypothetical protein